MEFSIGNTPVDRESLRFLVGFSRGTPAFRMRVSVSFHFRYGVIELVILVKDEITLREGHPPNSRVTKRDLGNWVMVKKKTAVEAERRWSQRFRVNAPISISLDDKILSGFTRDMSNRGIYFYLDSAEASPLQSGDFEFLVELPSEITISTRCQVRCVGKLKRIEPGRSNLTGYAAEILKYKILRNPTPMKITLVPNKSLVLLTELESKAR